MITILLGLNAVSLTVLTLFFNLQNRSVLDVRGENLTKYTFVVIPIFILGVLIIGLRSLEAGFDTSRYVLTYNNLDGFSSAKQVGESIYGNTEYLWWYLQSVFKYLGFSAQNWLLLNFTIVFFVTYFAYRHFCRTFKLAPFIFAFVFYTYYSVYSGNAMRQAFAIPLGLLGFTLIIDKKNFKGILCVLFSVGLHWSAIFLLIAPIFKSILFRNKKYFTLMPVAALVLSFVFIPISGMLMSFIGVAELNTKHELYFSGNYNSHVGVIWTKFNFWLCVAVPLIYLYYGKLQKYNYSIYCYTAFFVSLIILGVHIPDFSERYFPYILIVLPIIVADLLKCMKLPVVLGNSIYILFFYVLSILVFFSNSASETLGY